MSSDLGAASHDDDLDVSLNPETKRLFIIVLAICTLCVIAVAVFVVLASEDAGPVVERIQDQRDTAAVLVNSLFA